MSEPHCHKMNPRTQKGIICMTIIVICYVAVDGIAFVATFYKSYFSLILSQLFFEQRSKFRTRTSMWNTKNLELKNETSRFRPLVLLRELRIQTTFSWLPSFLEAGHPKAKIEKSQCKNEKRSNPDSEFSFSAGIFFVNASQRIHKDFGLCGFFLF